MRSSGRSVPPASPYNDVFAVGDFNHNGIPDLVQSSLKSCWMERRHPDTWAASEARSAAYGSGFQRRRSISDVVYTESNRIQVFFGDGRGGFSDGPQTGTGGSASSFARPTSIATAAPDLVISRRAAMASPSRPTWARAMGPLPRAARLPGAWFWVELGDVDRDGIIGRHGLVASNGVTAFLGNGQGGVRGH